MSNRYAQYSSDGSRSRSRSSSASSQGSRDSRRQPSSTEKNAPSGKQLEYSPLGAAVRAVGSGGSSSNNLASPNSQWAPLDVGIQGSFADPPPHAGQHRVIRSASSVNSSSRSMNASSIEMAQSVLLDDDDDDGSDDAVVRRHARLQHDIAELQDIFHRLDMELSTASSAAASPTNDTASINSSASFASMASNSSFSGSPSASPQRKYASMLGLHAARSASYEAPGSPGSSVKSPGQHSLASIVSSGQTSLIGAVPSAIILRSTSMRGAVSVRQSMVAADQPDLNLTHHLPPELVELRALSEAGSQLLRDGHRTAALSTSGYALAHTLRSLEKQNKKLEATYAHGNTDCGVYPDEALDLGNNDIARIATNHQQFLTTLQVEHAMWRQQQDESKHFSDADKRRMVHILDKITLQADAGLRRGDTVEESRQFLKLQTKLVDALKYAIFVEQINLRKLEQINASRDLVQKYKSVTPQPRKGTMLPGQQQHQFASPDGRRRGGGGGASNGPAHPLWGSVDGGGVGGSPFVSKLFAPDSGQEQKLLRLRKGALQMKMAPM